MDVARLFGYTCIQKAILTPVEASKAMIIENVTSRLASPPLKDPGKPVQESIESAGDQQYLEPSEKVILLAPIAAATAQFWKQGKPPFSIRWNRFTCSNQPQLPLHSATSAAVMCLSAASPTFCSVRYASQDALSTGLASGTSVPADEEVVCIGSQYEHAGTKS